MLATSIIAVLVATSLGGLALWWAAQMGNRALQDPRYRRRVLRLGGIIYIVFTVLVVGAVATRRERVEALYGLPMGALIAWILLRAAAKTKVPR